METIGIMGLYRDYKVYLGVIWDDGKENGNYRDYRVIWGL